MVIFGLRNLATTVAGDALQLWIIIFGDNRMGFIDSLFFGVKVFVKELVTVVGEAVRVILEEIDRSSFGKAAAELLQGITRKYFSQAESLAAEERELVEKRKHDGKRSEKDEERLSEIHAEREGLRKEMEAAKINDAAEEFRAESDKVISVEMTQDELSAAVGILASKKCLCGGIMRLRQGRLKSGTEKRDFYWQCTMCISWDVKLSNSMRKN